MCCTLFIHKIFLKTGKFPLYFWLHLWYHQKAGFQPDAITMPVAQFREKAVFSVHHPPSTWHPGNIFERWIFP